MLDELMEHSIKLIGKAFIGLVKLVAWVVVECFYSEIAWWAGWCVSRVVTLNSRPKVGFNDYDLATFKTKVMVGSVGIAFLLLAASQLAFYLSNSSR